MKQKQIVHLFAAFFATVVLLCFPALTQAKDVWTKVRTQNFELIGNSSESEIRAVAAKLESFREFFRQTFPRLKVDSTLPIRVVVFNSVESYQPFQPIRANGETDSLVRGYFATGMDVRYITVTNSGKTTDAFDAIYHEYAHFILNNNLDRANLPPWLNEGLAGYFQTFRVENENKAVLGTIQPTHLRLLQTETLIPFESLFKTDNFALHNQGDHGRSLFYAESWALMHYFQHGGRREQFNKFFNLLLEKKPIDEAFQTAFQIDAATLEKELKDYISANTFETKTVMLNSKTISLDIQPSTVLSESASEALLGDLLLHLNRNSEAAVRLEKALGLDESSPMANAALGIVRMQQKNYAEAQKLLEKAVKFETNNFLLPFYYAYVLSRQDTDSYGYIKSIAPERALKIRQLLKRSIELNPEFAESYYLFASVNLVNDENLNEAVDLIEKALRLDAGNLKYKLTLAQIKLRQTDYDAAEEIAGNVFAAAAEQDVRLNAQAIVISSKNIREQLKRIAESQKLNSKGEFPSITQEEGLLQAMNEALRKPISGENRVLGYLTQINCDGKNSTFQIREQSSGEILKLSAEAVQKVNMKTFAPNLEGKQIGCGLDKSDALAVVTFRPKSDSQTNGDVVAVEFVPSYFRFLH